MYSNGFVVAVKINDKSVEEKEGKAILPFDSEYTIMLKNRNDRKAVARVYIDGEEVTKTGRLILDANSSLNLERYIENMNEGRKFKFVSLSNDRVQDKKDGEKGYVEVRFQLVKPTQSQVIIHEEHIYHHKHHNFNDYWDYPIYKGPYFLGNSINTSSLGFGSSSSGGLSSLTSINSSSGEQICYNAHIEDNKLVEEAGATIKGSNSNQKFSYSYVGELEAQETVIRFKLVGTKDEQIIKEFTKTHCTKCGKKYDVSDRYCSGCGEKK